MKVVASTLYIFPFHPRNRYHRRQSTPVSRSTSCGLIGSRAPETRSYMIFSTQRFDVVWVAAVLQGYHVCLYDMIFLCFLYFHWQILRACYVMRKNSAVVLIEFRSTNINWEGVCGVRHTSYLFLVLGCRGSCVQHGVLRYRFGLGLSSWWRAPAGSGLGVWGITGDE